MGCRCQTVSDRRHASEQYEESVRGQAADGLFEIVWHKCRFLFPALPEIIADRDAAA